jgi:hypothetical protein
MEAMSQSQPELTTRMTSPSDVSFSEHALQRIAQRMAMAPSEIALIVNEAIERGSLSRMPPSWATRADRRSAGIKQSRHSPGLRWVRFVADGAQHAILVETERTRAHVVTVIRRGNDALRRGSKLVRRGR